MSVLRRNSIVQSEITHQRYVIKKRLGSGGFGDAYWATRLDERDREVEDVCLKVTSDANSWHGEAFYAGLLSDHNHVVHMRDAFPIMIGRGRAARMRFCIEMELIVGGTVEDGCIDGRLPWPEQRVERQIRLLLQPLAALHSVGASHRDITPRNVFLGQRSTLKLGDFGIAKTALKPAGVHADAYAPAYRPPMLGTYWSTADDVYQVGLLALTLAAGKPMDNSTTKWNVNPHTSNGRLRNVIKKAIGVKSQRYPDAQAMLEALTD